MKIRKFCFLFPLPIFCPCWFLASCGGSSGTHNQNIKNVYIDWKSSQDTIVKSNGELNSLIVECYFTNDTGYNITTTATGWTRTTVYSNHSDFVSSNMTCVDEQLTVKDYFWVGEILYTYSVIPVGADFSFTYHLEIIQNNKATNSNILTGYVKLN